MGTFVGCSVVGSTCRCSYTQGSTVAGCGSGRNSYITYSYGSVTDITYTNESPTCSYNFAGTIGVPPSSSSSGSRTSSVSASYSRSASIARTSSVSLSITRSLTASPTPTYVGLCQVARNTFNGQRVTVNGDVVYYVSHFVNITHQQGTGELWVGSLTSCTETAVACNCNYGPGSNAIGCSLRWGYITYQYGTATMTTFQQQNPSCYYYFLGTIGLPSTSSTVSPSRTISPTSTPLTRPVLIADSAIDFPSVQGQNGWYYNYYDVANVLRPMPFYGTNSLIASGSYWQIQNTVCVIGTTLLHPAHSSSCTTTFQGNCKPTVFWNNTYSNNNTLYIVSYTAAHPTNFPGTNGVKITLKYNDLVLHSVSPTFTIAQTNYSIYNLSSLEVALDPLAHCDSDSTTYNLKIYQYQTYPSTSASPTSTPTFSMTPSATLSLSQTRTGSGSSSPSSSDSPSLSESPSSTPTSSQTRTGSGTSSGSPSLTSSESPSPSESPSSTPTPSQTQTGSGSSTGSPSLSPSLSLSESSSETSTPTPSLTQTGSGSSTGSLTASASRTSSETGSQSRGPSRSSTMTATTSDSPSFSPSMIYSTPTSTPLIYCIPYPSSTPTAESTPTSTPLYFMTRYPSNATASASTSPFFMMIPYASTTPSSAPVSNQTLLTPPLDITGIAIGSTVIGLAGIGGLLALLHYMRPLLERAKDHKNQSQEPDVVIVQPDPYDKLAHICVDPADLLEITQFLQSLKKEFIVIEPRYT